MVKQGKSTHWWFTPEGMVGEAEERAKEAANTVEGEVVRESS